MDDKKFRRTALIVAGGLALLLATVVSIECPRRGDGLGQIDYGVDVESREYLESNYAQR